MPDRPPPLADQPDDVLWAHCCRGSQGAWIVLVRRYQRLIYTVPRRAGLGDDAAADVFQFTFSRLFEQLGKLQDPTRLRAWLVTTAKRETLRVLELAKREVTLDPDFGQGESEGEAENPLERIADPQPLPPELLESLQQHDKLRRAVERLDERSRRFVELLFLQEEPLPYSEIAARLGIAEGSIGPTRARCLAKLRALFDDD